MLIFKVIIQVILGAVGFLALTLDYSKTDKRRNTYKTIRKYLFWLQGIVIVAGIYLTISDDMDKENESKFLKERLVSIESNSDTLKSQLRPFVDYAKSIYPNISPNAALDSLKERIEHIDSDLFRSKETVSMLSLKADRLEKKIKIISNIEFRIYVDEITHSETPGGRQTSAGIATIMGLFDNGNHLNRFITDYQFSIQQIASDKKRVSFNYKPENPGEILGRSIAHLSNTQMLSFNFSELPMIFGIPDKEKKFLVSCILLLNGKEIKVVDNFRLSDGKLFQGQVNIPVANIFLKIEKTYNDLIENEINQSI